MLDNINLYSLSFIQPSDIIEKIEDGYSGALLYKITRNKNKFFLKIFNSQFDSFKISRLEEICSIYRALKINSLDIIYYDKISDINRYFVVYNFIDGLNLKRYTQLNKCNSEEVRQFGKYIGNELLKLKNYNNYNNNLLKNNDLFQDIVNTIDTFYSLLETNNIKDTILEYFSLKELTTLKNTLFEYSNTFKNSSPNLIHGDIKMSNFMIDNHKKIHIVDIEDMQVNYDMINFKYQMTWFLFYGNKMEKEFVKGYFDGLYNFTRPEQFNYHIVFVTILNFFAETISRIKRADINALKDYQKKCKRLFSKLNTINLNNNFII